MKYYVVDAFTDKVFKGNPAGVCLLEKELPDKILQKIAFENNLAETAFLLKKKNKYILRWFTPEVEMDLCGHATLATAFVIMNYIDKSCKKIEFHTISGKLIVKRNKELYTMDFPARKPCPVSIPPLLIPALRCHIAEAHLSRDLLVLLDKESDVLNLKPNIEKMSSYNFV